MKSASVVVLCVLQLALLVASQSVPIYNITLVPRIDTHCHYLPPFYRDLLISRGILAGGLPIPNWNVTAHLAANALVGTTTSVVSVSTPGAKLTATDSIEEGRTLARQLNEYGRNLTLEYPGTFLYFATLTLPDLDGAVAEAVYALDNLGAAGVILEASTFGELLGTPRFAPLYQVLDDRKAVVFIHPSNSPCPEETLFLPNSTSLPSFVVDFLLDTSRAGLNLLYRNVTRDYPNIKFILAHSGGFLPFAVTRATGGLALLSGSPANQALFEQELSTKFFVDLALSASEFALPSTTKLLNASRITWGSDFPYSPVAGIEQNALGLQSFQRLGLGAKTRINYRNAHALFAKFLK